MRLVPMVTVAALFAPVSGASGAQDLSSQEATARITDVRHVRWIWKAEFDLPAAAHVVIVDWHPALGLERRYPRRGLATQPLDAGPHTVVGDEGAARRRGMRPGNPVSQGTVSITSMNGIGWGSLSALSLDFNASTLTVIGTRESAAPSTRFATPPGSRWQAFVLSIPVGVSAAEVDSTIAEIDASGDAAADVNALATALGATAWGGQTPGLRRRSGL